LQKVALLQASAAKLSIATGRDLYTERAAILPLVRRCFARHLVFVPSDLRWSRIMVCTITSLIAFAAFGVLAVGCANLPRLGARIRLRAARFP
jgi:hypothetical protein